MAEKKLNATAEKILAFLNAHKGEAFTFDEIKKATGIEAKSTGAITRLMAGEKTNGVITHGEKKVKEVVVKRKVETYMIANDTDTNAN